MSDSGQDIAAIERDIAVELLRIQEEAYGRGAGSAKAHYLENTVICLLDDLELLPNEAFLVKEGRPDAVIDVRGQYQQAIQTTYRAAVERATGRSVISFVSATKVDPNWSVEIFRLAPAVSRRLGG